MTRILLAAGRYVQGAGLLREIGGHAARLGRCGLVIGGKTALALCYGDMAASFLEHGITCRQELFGGVSSRMEVSRLVAAARSAGADFIVALGGGASIDAGKAVSHELNLPVIVVPTTAATDGPCSALSVIYTEAGVFERYVYLRRNPDCVLVDTAVIAQSPARFLVAGMGDAIAGFWESGTCARSGRGATFSGGDTPTLAALALSRLCYETLLEHGVAARLAVERQVVTPAVESIVEANILLSGLSSENGGHAAAHSIHNGLTVLPAMKSRLHGEKVAFGLLAQMVLEGRPSRDILEVQCFCHAVGLPVCLADLGVEDPSHEDVRRVADAAVAEGETIHLTWFPVTAEMVEAAIWGADALGIAFKKEGPRRGDT